MDGDQHISERNGVKRFSLVITSAAWIAARGSIKPPGVGHLGILWAHPIFGGIVLHPGNQGPAAAVGFHVAVDLLGHGSSPGLNLVPAAAIGSASRQNFLTGSKLPRQCRQAEIQRQRGGTIAERRASSIGRPKCCGSVGTGRLNLGHRLGIDCLPAQPRQLDRIQVMAGCWCAWRAIGLDGEVDAIAVEIPTDIAPEQVIALLFAGPDVADARGILVSDSGEIRDIPHRELRVA